MKRISVVIGLLLTVLLLPLNADPAYAQSGVEFSIRYNAGVYEVYMRPDFTPTDKSTLTAQVTVKVPTGNGADQFQPAPEPTGGAYVGDVAGPTWSIISTEAAPTEDTNSDYISWNLNIGGDATVYNWTAGQEVLAFRFTSTNGCLGVVSLMEDNDPFNTLPNSAGTNPGNQIALNEINAGTTNAYTGNYGSAADCSVTGSIYGIDEDNNLGVYNVTANTFTVIQNLGTNNADDVDALAYVSETILIGNKDDSSGPNFVRLGVTGPTSVVETPITVTNPGSIPGGASGYSYDVGTYDGSTNTYYTTEENNTIFLAFTYDVGANTLTYDSSFTASSSMNGDDWALYNDGTSTKIYGVDNNTLEIWDFQNGTYQEVNLDVTNSEVAGVFNYDGLIYVMDRDGDVHTIDPNVTDGSGDVVYTPLGQTESVQNWGDERSDFASAGSSVDTISPVPTISGPFSHDGSTAFDLTIDFGEDITGFDASDVTVTNGTIDSVTGGPQSYTVSITPSGTNDVTVSVPANAAQDGAGNQSTASSNKVVSYSTGVGSGNNLVAFVHGADNDNGAGLGTSVWASLGDGTFTTCQIDTTGFDRDGTGTEVFGYDNSSYTFFVDVNGDNLADIVHTSTDGSNSIRAYFANGDGTFATTASATTTGFTGVTSGNFSGLSGSRESWIYDVTGDGVADYSQSGDDDTIHTWLGNGDGTFQTTVLGSTALNGGTGDHTSGQNNDHQFFLTDFNQDGCGDLIGATNKNSNTFQVWLNLCDGNGTFNPNPVETNMIDGNSSGGITGVGSDEVGFIDDVTGDGLPDFVAARDGGLFVYANLGSGSFSATVTQSTTGLGGPFASKAGEDGNETGQLIDVTSDGILDYVMSKDNEGGNSGIYVYAGNGDGTFNTTPIVTNQTGGLANFQTGLDNDQSTLIVPLFPEGIGVDSLCNLIQLVDSDGDGLPDDVDPDDDNDGILDVNETGDTDGDGIPDSLESNILDSDADGSPDFDDSNADGDGEGPDGTGGEEAGVLTGPWNDADGDGIPAHLDPNDGTAGPGDADGDGINDDIECPGGYICPDSDNDGVPDYADVDSDNDGIDDVIEGTTDSDSDGIPDRLEPNNVDTDNDGTPNHQDNDDDGDSIPTATECPAGIPCPDGDGDGIPDYLEHNGPSPAGDQDGDGIADADDPDADGDGIPDAVEGNGDVDGDGIPNNLDLDSDGDNIPDVIEAGGTDADGDGQADGPDANNDGIIDTPLDPYSEDADTDGIPDAYEPNNVDTDNDGTPNHLDDDDDGDSIPTATECANYPACPDADNDGIPNYLEHNGPSPAGDTDGDGVPDAQDADSDGDGILDVVEGNIDTDNDGTPDNLDLDSDNDAILDVIEAGGTDADGDGQQDGTTDADGDGIVDTVDPSEGGTPLPLTDTDTDNVPDYLENNYADPDGDGDPNVNDPDDDGDGIPTATECPAGPPCPDGDQDGIPDYLEASGAAPASDNDGDGVPDDQDLDSDNDGILDATEGNVDTDNDGTPDYLDSDSDNDGIPDVLEAGGTDNDGDGQLDGGVNGTTGIPTNGPLNPATEDADNDNVPDYLESAVTDTDGDGLDNQFDDNDDGDHLPTATECPNGPVCPDADGDGIPNYLEANDDPSTGGTTEGDTDGDGIPDANDPDADGDGIPDVVEGTGDIDGDGIPNNLDLDSDGDGTDDVIEAGGTDGNGDGMADGVDGNGDGIIDTPLDPFGEDADGDGIPDAYEPDDVDTDGNSTMNEMDNDDDGDGIPTATECASFPNCPDADNDGIPDYLESNTQDADGDTIPDALDGDSDGDGIPDAEEGAAGGLLDTDGDSVPDHLDLDSDNDGINDVVEAGGTDADGDGQQDGTADADGDGIIDTVDPSEGGTALPVPDSDGDGQDDFQDLDSDNDTISDLIEGGSGAADANDDGVADGPDGDGDGIVDNADGDPSNFGDATSPALPDKDSGSDDDNAPDYADVDDDTNSGALDIDGAGNGTLDGDNDGAIDNATDADNDGAADVVDTDDAVFGGLPATITSVTVPVKVILQGAYNDTNGTMNDDLRILASFPMTSPYGGGETATAGALAIADANDSIVDWVMVELRGTGAQSTTVVAAVAGLVQRDGDVVSAGDGTSDLSFTGVADGNYHVAVNHRNHLAVMTAAPVAVSASTALVNFTTMADGASYGTDSQKDLGGGVYALWAGDVNASSTVIRSGGGNDIDDIFTIVLDDQSGTNNTSHIVNGYGIGDVNMDGQTIASGPGNDLNLIIDNVVGHPGNNPGGSPNANYIVVERLPVAP